MFRAAAVVFVALGLGWLYSFAINDRQPIGIAAGALTLIVGVFLFRANRIAIGLSALATAVVSISAAVFAPTTHAEVILFLAALAIVCGVYAGLAARVLFERQA
jgi:F0F1-type ATP synthase membrane subunit a